jgi:hypothetical protein
MPLPSMLGGGGGGSNGGVVLQRVSAATGSGGGGVTLYGGERGYGSSGIDDVLTGEMLSDYLEMAAAGTHFTHFAHFTLLALREQD